MSTNRVPFEIQQFEESLTSFELLEAELTLLNGRLAYQQEFNKDAATGQFIDNIEIAKTYHSRGEILAKLSRHAEAIDSLQQSFAMKLRLNSSKIALDVIDTQRCLILSATALSELAPDAELHRIINSVSLVDFFDWQNFRTIKPFQSLLPLLKPLVSALVTVLRNKGNDLEDIDMADVPVQFKALCLSLATPLFQLGTYFLHVENSVYVAQYFLDAAIDFDDQRTLQGLWIGNHLALLGQQRLAQSFGKSADKLQEEYDEYKETFGLEEDDESTAENISVENIRKTYHNDAISEAEYVLCHLPNDSPEREKLQAFANFVIALADFQYEVMEPDQLAVRQKILQRLADVLKQYEALNDLGEQYLRVQTSYAASITDFNMLLKAKGKDVDESIAKFAAALPAPLDIYHFVDCQRRAQESDMSNPWAVPFYYSYALCLTAPFQVGPIPEEMTIPIGQVRVVQLGLIKCTLACEIISEFGSDDSALAASAVQLKEYLTNLLQNHRKEWLRSNRVSLSSSSPGTTGLFSTSPAVATASQRLSATPTQEQHPSASPRNG